MLWSFLPLAVTAFSPQPSSTALSSTAAVQAPSSAVFTIRTAGDADMAVVKDLLNKKRAFGLTMAEVAPGAKPPIAGSTLVSLHPESPTAKILLVEDGEDANADAFGFAMYRLKHYDLDSPPVLWLDRLFVDAERRSSGAGAALMQAVGDVCKAYRCPYAAWIVDRANTRVLDFYQRHGARVEGCDEDYYQLLWLPEDWQ